VKYILKRKEKDDDDEEEEEEEKPRINGKALYVCVCHFFSLIYR